MNIHKLIRIVTLALLVAAPFPARAQSSFENDPAYLAIDKALDLNAIKPEVNVNLPRFLLKDALSEMNGGPDDPLGKSGIDLADLVKDVKLIRVLVFEHKKDQHESLTKGVAALRGALESKWTAIAAVPEEGVGVYMLGDASGESMAGLAVLVHNDGDTVIVNIVGKVPIGKLIKAASSMDKFPKDLLKKLTEATNPDAAKSKPEKAPAK